jgi:c-di-GMP-binding flagellar brake protein YcgR
MFNGFFAMLAVSTDKERRKHRRFQINDLAIAVPNKPVPQVGRIVNISKGGMAIRYLDQTDWAGNADSIDILINSNLFITNIPVQNVSDFKVENQDSFSIMNERQCCLKFGSLSPDQELLLNEFIVTHGVGSS